MKSFVVEFKVVLPNGSEIIKVVRQKGYAMGDALFELQGKIGKRLNVPRDEVEILSATTEESQRRAELAWAA